MQWSAQWILVDQFGAPKLDLEGRSGAKSLHMLRASFCAALSFTFAASSLAASNDINLVGLVNDNGEAQNDQFRGLVRELGVVMTPSSLQPAETTGQSGFDFALDYTFHMEAGEAKLPKPPIK